LHALAPHTYGAQPPDEVGTHAPPPLQTPPLTYVPLAQLGVPQAVLPSGYLHCARCTPSHADCLHVGSLPLAGQAPWPLVGWLPLAIGEQTPASPARLQASHSPVHALVQHTPSAATPFEAHGTPATTGWPSRIAHWPRFDGSLQVPPLGHDALPQQTPSTQLPLVHCEPAPQVVPLPSFAAQWPDASQ
jgi:hypothetical protein